MARSALAIDRMLAPWDELRRRALDFALRVRPLRALVRDRDHRVAAISTISVSIGLFFALFLPAAMFAVSPVVLGVPHVAADVRYLVLRRRMARWWRWAIFGTCGLMVALRIAEEIDGSPALLAAEVGIGVAWLGLAAVAGALASRSWRRFAVAAPVVAAIAFFAAKSPFYAVVALAHVHNLVAIALWLILFRRRRTSVVLPLALISVGLIAIFSGATLPLTERLGGLQGLGADLREVATWLVPGAPARFALLLTVAYVFVQSIHYSVWLGWIPQEDVRAEGSLTFRMSARSLLRDFGVLGVGAIVLGMIVVAAFAMKSLLATREVYLSIAAFHGYLEVAILFYLFTAGTRPYAEVPRFDPAPRPQGEASCP